MIAVQLADDSIQKTARRQQIIDGLHDIPSQIKKVLAMDKTLQSLAKDLLSDQKSLLIMGRGYQCGSDAYRHRKHGADIQTPHASKVPSR